MADQDDIEITGSGKIHDTSNLDEEDSISYSEFKSGSKTLHDNGAVISGSESSAEDAETDASVCDTATENAFVFEDFEFQPKDLANDVILREMFLQLKDADRDEIVHKEVETELELELKHVQLLREAHEIRERAKIECLIMAKDFTNDVHGVIRREEGEGPIGEQLKDYDQMVFETLDKMQGLLNSISRRQTEYIVELKKEREDCVLEVANERAKELRATQKIKPKRRDEPVLNNPFLFYFIFTIAITVFTLFVVRNDLIRPINP